jgi:hypothetical protein
MISASFTVIITTSPYLGARPIQSNRYSDHPYSNQLELLLYMSLNAALNLAIKRLCVSAARPVSSLAAEPNSEPSRSEGPLAHPDLLSLR